MENEFSEMKGVRPSNEELRRRVEHVKSIIVHHPIYMTVLEELEMRFALGNDSLTSECLYLYGPTGAGKSTVIREFVSRYPPFSKTSEYSSVPVLHVKVPLKATASSLASKVLLDLGYPFPTRRTELNHVRSLIMEREVKMLILEGAEHLNSKTINWVKTLIGEVNIPVVLCGISESMWMFVNDPQLNRLFTNKLELAPFRYGNKKETSAFLGFLHVMERQLPFAKPTNLTEKTIAERLYYASLGVASYLMQLMIEATICAVNDGDDSIELEHLNQAFERIKLISRPFIVNPFALDDFELEAELKREKGNNFRAS
ncbi:TniB protein [Paenibacillus taihuensis]|uniref:TniB protein n=1 Tax=Paenibacillus taihuensis TaxID=1156355 RepID=A0A3D9QVP5_9BACL|nr:TniB family NTP-binding protein [Paenibacillus taihuensis]REE67296.1 TniB protein [Paenibacillus taihuensis]